VKTDWTSLKALFSASRRLRGIQFCHSIGEYQEQLVQIIGEYQELQIYE
jgi:hypothetical protein